MPTEPESIHINAQHVQTSARLQMYKQRDNLMKGNLVKNPAVLIQPPSIVGNSGGSALETNEKQKGRDTEQNKTVPGNGNKTVPGKL